MSHLAPGSTVGRYRVEGHLGGGGMADVYLVRHMDLLVPRALKVLKRADADRGTRLLQEGQLQASLRHPGIVSVLEVVDVHGHPSLIMDFVDGPALNDVVGGGGLGLEQVDLLARQIFDAMEAAHARGLVHRDLKPANILLDLEAKEVRARVVDFGLAKSLDAVMNLAETASGVVMGTPRYMAPEQFRDAKAVDARADVWALGAVLYELLTGRPAFPASDFVDAVRLIDEASFTPVQRWVPDVPSRMVRAIDAALVSPVHDRVQSVAELRGLWVDEAPPPDPDWDLAALRACRPSEKLRGAYASTATLGGTDPGLTAAVLETMPIDVHASVPSAEATQGLRPWVWGLAGVGGLGLVGAIGLALMSLAAAPVPERAPPVVVDTTGSEPPPDTESADTDTVEAVVVEVPVDTDELGLEAVMEAVIEPAPGLPTRLPLRRPDSAAGPESDPEPDTDADTAADTAADTDIDSDTVVASPPPPPAPGRFTNLSRGVDVHLRDAGGQLWSQGEVPSGSYVIVAPGVGPAPGAVQVSPGSRVLIRCARSTAACSVEVKR